MGQQSPVLLLFRLTAASAASLTSTTTLRPSLEGPGGGFDVPKEKCPPDIQPGGSLSEVTARSAPSLLCASKSTTQLATQHHFTKDLHYHHHHHHHHASIAKSSYSVGSTPPSSTASSMLSLAPSASSHVRDFPYSRRYDPPLSPTNSTPGTSPEETQPPVSRHRLSSPVSIPTPKASKVVNGFTISMQDKPLPLETPPTTPVESTAGGSGEIKFLSAVFPDSELIRKAYPYARGVSIAQDGVTFEGFVLALPGGKHPKTLYVCGRGAESVQLRESIVALLDLADEHLGCSAFVIALERESPALAGLIHSLMYVSGQVVTKPPFPVADKYVLVGIEI